MTCAASCPCQGSGGTKGPCLTVPRRAPATRHVPASPWANLPPEDRSVWRNPAPGATVAVRVGKWTAADRTRAKDALRAAGSSWREAYDWAVDQGVTGLNLCAMNPKVVVKFLAQRKTEATA